MELPVNGRISEGIFAIIASHYSMQYEMNNNPITDVVPTRRQSTHFLSTQTIFATFFTRNFYYFCDQDKNFKI